MWIQITGMHVIECMHAHHSQAAVRALHGRNSAEGRLWPTGTHPVMRYCCSRHARIICLDLQPEGLPTCVHTPRSDAASATRLGALGQKTPDRTGVRTGSWACPSCQESLAVQSLLRKFGWSLDLVQCLPRRRGGQEYFAIRSGGGVCRKITHSNSTSRTIKQSSRRLSRSQRQLG